MPFTPKAIHQFHGGSGVGDAITAGLFYTRELLRGLGFASEIYCIDVAAALEGEIHAAPTFVDDPEILLLVHFSWAIAYDQWLARLKCRKALVYHNITPEEFFDGGWFNTTAQVSRRQLAGLRPLTQAALAQSHYSARELESAGFSPVDVLPLLFDPATWRSASFDTDYLEELRADDAFKILFVGRIVTNKCQEDLVRVVDRLRRMMAPPEKGGRAVKLILAGGLGAGAAYRDRLVRVTRELGLEAHVELAGKVDDARLKALYRGCDVFLSLSEHEGFCVPVIEAMAFDLPVVAYAASAVPETVGQGGLVLADKDAGRVAATLKVLSDEPELRRRLVRAGRDNVRRFSRDRTIHGLARFLRDRLDVAVDVPPPPAELTEAEPTRWRLEGPFDSSYSLALVNRSLAKALARDKGAAQPAPNRPIQVGLHSTEGDGDFAPNASFLAHNPDVAALWQHGRDMGGPGPRPDVVLRNLYPPRVSGMEAPTRVLGNWGWEESGLPSPWVARFNSSLNLVTAISPFVAKVLVDNGVKVPVAVVGNGCEHFQQVEPVAMDVSPHGPILGTGSFRFLHVSSGFPRKGVDVLLAAWGRAFTTAHDVTLVIKTFPNPHNTVKEQVEALRLQAPNAAEIVLIDADVGTAEMAWLYRNCHALVAPSRGEGFGLPVAEAMLHELPAIVTGHGGMRAFCDERTAWLVDYRFTDAQSHFELFNSAWTEPLADDLVRALREVHAAPVEERARRGKAARQTIEALFTWPAVARRTREAVADLDRRPALSPLPRVAWVTSWNVRCGIASYARHLASEFPKGSLQVMASQADALLEADEPFVQRCWKQGWDDDLQALGLAIRRSGATQAVFQFNFGFFEITAFGHLLDRLREDGIACHVVLHSTQDVNKPGIQISLGEIRDSLGRAARLLVHGIADLNTLKGFGLVENVTLFPHGVALTVPADLAALRRDGGLAAKRVIASFGYLLPNKGVRPLIEAFAGLHAQQPDLHLLLLTSLYPVPDSHEELARCRVAIDRLGLQGAITLVTDYLSDDDAQALLQTAELIVYAYQHSQESASGAVRFGLASGRPVACTPLSIFDDVHRVVHTLPGISAEDLARGIGELMGDRAKLDRLAERQAGLLAANNWPTLSARLWNILRAPAVIDLVAEDRRKLSLVDNDR